MRHNLFSNQMMLWIGALIIGAILGWMNIAGLNEVFSFIATVFTHLFQFVAVPTIALAILTTLASLGGHSEAGLMFGKTIVFTLLTTICAAIVGLILFVTIAPTNLPADVIGMAETAAETTEGLSFYDHILSVIPSNILQPFISGNVLSILLVAAAFGLGLAKMPSSEKKTALMNVILGAQDLLNLLIKALIKVLPIGIIAFAAQLVAQVEGGIIVGSLGAYTAVILCANLVQFFIVLPLFLFVRGLNPLRILKGMMPAILMALFTKSSAATLPVTIKSAEENLNIKPQTARFVLPICCTINMNGCATFILVTSLYVMQNGGEMLSLGGMLMWLLISVVSAIGNAGVPMGCYFLTLSLMAGINAPALSIMGIILPIFTIIDMIETAENVWSDSCVCAIVDHTKTK